MGHFFPTGSLCFLMTFATTCHVPAIKTHVTGAKTIKTI